MEVFRLRFRFTDGSKGVANASALAVRTARWSCRWDPTCLNRVFVEAGALTWPNRYDGAGRGRNP